MPSLTADALTVVDPVPLRRELERALRDRTYDIVCDEEPELATRTIAVAAYLEIGTPNDQLTTQLRDMEVATPIPLDAASPELVTYRGTIGLRVRYRGHDRIDARWLRPLVHPSLSLNADGSVRELVIFPRTVARICHAGRGDTRRRAVVGAKPRARQRRAAAALLRSVGSARRLAQRAGVALALLRAAAAQTHPLLHHA
jgi:hypothetical protein